MYLAIARKWRPSRFEDLVGQGHVVQTLKNSIVQGRVSHAYLFSGARGVGKTSVARIFAKALRCPNAKDGTSCNTCEECLAISESRSMDVVEIDGASNNGVEAVRAIRDNVAYGAASGKYKIYIIDEVHMLSISAFNALLKTLEEPPAHVVFIFATTEVQKLPLTILSRCQRFEFRRLSIPQVVERLKTIVGSEKVSIDEEGMRMIASHGDGSLRDSLSLLDQVLSYFSQGDKALNLTAAHVVEALGVADTNAITGFLEKIIRKDSSGLLKLISETYASGVDLKHFAERVLEELRLLFLVTVSKAEKIELTADSLDISTSKYTELETLAAKVSTVQLERMAQILSRVIQQLNWASLPQFVLEMAALRMSRLDTLAQIEQTLLSEAPVAVAASALAPASRPSPVATAEAAPPVGQKLFSKPVVNDSDPWRGFIEMVMKRRPLLGTLLSHGSYRFDETSKGKALTLVFTKDSFFERQAKDSKRELEQFVKDHFGPEMLMRLTNNAADAEKSIEQLRSEDIEAVTKDALEHPAVGQMQKLLGAEVVDVRVEG